MADVDELVVHVVAVLVGDHVEKVGVGAGNPDAAAAGKPGSLRRVASVRVRAAADLPE